MITAVKSAGPGRFSTNGEQTRDSDDLSRPTRSERYTARRLGETRPRTGHQGSRQASGHRQRKALAERQFAPDGVIFPVSSVLLDRIDEYRRTLQAHSGPLMNCIDWRPTPDRNVEVVNDTADLYRYFDCTGEAEFLHACVARTVEHDLPMEIDLLRRQDEAQRRIMEMVELPGRLTR